jgi:hypothetical protein
MEVLMSDQQLDEKNEKDEKEPRKHEEKTADEKWRRDPLSAIIWACILIWAGLCFLADNLGWLAQLNLPGNLPENVRMYPSVQVWTLIVLGAALIVVAEIIIRLVIPAYRQPLGGSIFFAAILFAIGIGNLFGWSLVFPVILIAIGLQIILRPRHRR